MTRILKSLAVGAALVCAGHVPPVSAAEKINGQTFAANGVKIWYFVEGTGEPVVLIHGWLSSAGINWTLPGTTALLAKDHQVIALDMRGHGLSDKPTNEDAYGPELVEDVGRLLDRLQIKKAHIVGYSMGGIVAANFIAKHPDRVLSGLLGGMGWLKPGGAAQWCFARIGKNEPHAQATAICGRSLAKLAVTEAEIRAIHVPLEILIGDIDRLMRALYVTQLERLRPDWPVIDIKDADHISCILKPQFQQEIAAWLKKNKQ